MRHKHKRYLKNFLIAPKEQFLFGFFVLTSVFLTVGMHTLLVIKKIRALSEAGLLSESDSELVFYTLWSFAVTIAVLGIFIFVMNIVFTHRIFGSLYVIEQLFRNAIDGKPLRALTSRKYDLTISLVRTINEFFAKYKDVIKEKPDSGAQQ